MEAAISEKPTLLHQLHEWQKEHISGFLCCCRCFFPALDH